MCVGLIQIVPTAGDFSFCNFALFNLLLLSSYRDTFFTRAAAVFPLNYRARCLGRDQNCLPNLLWEFFCVLSSR
jgi:hypothetical protein